MRRRPGGEGAPDVQAEAKKRQEVAGLRGDEGGRGNKKPETLPPTSAGGFDVSLSEKAKKNSEGEALHQAGKAAGVGKTSVTAAKRARLSLRRSGRRFALCRFSVRALPRRLRSCPKRLQPSLRPLLPLACRLLPSCLPLPGVPLTRLHRPARLPLLLCLPISAYRLDVLQAIRQPCLRHPVHLPPRAQLVVHRSA